MASRSKPIPIAFVAGIIDARGHIEVSMRHDKPQPRLSVTTKRVELLEWLGKITGTKVSYDTRGYERRPCNEHCNQQHSHVVRQSAKWRVDSSRATVVLFNVAPHIVGQRKEVLEALRVGMASWPAARGDTAAQMARLGWPLPEKKNEATSTHRDTSRPDTKAARDAPSPERQN